MGFVPTMGALHEGHGSLVKASAQQCSETVVSIYVNPTQFGPGEDLSRYPRPLEADLEKCRASGATAVICPTTEDMYSNTTTVVTTSGPSEKFEGEFRPHHFQGVTTVVAKLLNIVQPNDVFFGLKDLQQCAVIRNMLMSLCYGCRMHALETVRESSGLALSSRNQYLSDEARVRASLLYATLKQVATRLSIVGFLSVEHLQEVLDTARSNLDSHGFSVQYLAVVDELSFEPARTLKGARVIVAAYFEGVRLIDNCAIIV